MLHVRELDVGPVAYARLVRDGLLHDVIGVMALPRDLDSAPAVREAALSHVVPSHTWTTGLAALWVHGYAPCPAVIDVVGARGLHRTEPRVARPIIRFHSGSGEGLPTSGARVAAVSRAVVDSLRHGPLEHAIPASVRALSARAVTTAEFREAVNGLEVHTRGRAALASLAAVIAAAVDRQRL